MPLIAQEILLADAHSPVRTLGQPHVFDSAPVIDPLIVVVSRADVEQLDTQETLMTLQRWIETSRDPHEVRGRLQLAFHGYDDNPRELWEMSEVRTFIDRLDREFPYWFYLADLRSDFLMVVAFCLCRVFSSHPGATRMDSQDFAAFLDRHFRAMNQLAVVGDEEPIPVLGALDGAFHFTTFELPVRIGVTTQTPQNHERALKSVTVLQRSR